MARDSNKSSTVLKAFKVLEAVAAGAGPMSAADVAEAAGLIVEHGGPAALARA